MEFKEFIEKPRTLTAKINLKEAQLEALKTQSLYAVSVPSQTPGGNQHYDSVIEKHVAKQDELERLIPSLKQEREAVVAELTLLLSELEDPRQIRILTMRYVQLLEFPEIIKRIKYSSQHVFRMHKAGLAAAKKIYLKKESK